MSETETAPNPLDVRVIGERRPGDPRASLCSGCAHCSNLIEWLPGGTWTRHGGWECPAREGESGHGPHEPGKPILHPPTTDQRELSGTYPATSLPTIPRQSINEQQGPA